MNWWKFFFVLSTVLCITLTKKYKSIAAQAKKAWRSAFVLSRQCTVETTQLLKQFRLSTIPRKNRHYVTLWMEHRSSLTLWASARGPTRHKESLPCSALAFPTAAPPMPTADRWRRKTASQNAFHMFFVSSSFTMRRHTTHTKCFLNTKNHLGLEETSNALLQSYYWQAQPTCIFPTSICIIWVGVFLNNWK